MRSANFLRFVFAMAVGALVLVLANLWGEVPAGIGPCGDDQPGVISHCVLQPPPLAMMLKIVVSFLVVVGSAVFAAKAFPKLSIVAGAVSSTLASLLWLATRHTIDAQIFDIGFSPQVDEIAVVGGSSFILGALVAWGMQRWWPNKSLERTREG